MTANIPMDPSAQIDANSSNDAPRPRYIFSATFNTAGTLVAEPRYAGGLAKVAAVFIAVTAANAASPQITMPHSHWIPLESRSSSKKRSGSDQKSGYDAFELLAMRQQYNKLDAAVENLTQLSEDDAHYLDKDVSEEGRKFLQFLSEISVFPPKIFPHGGDTLVFEWEAFDGIRYVTFENDVARIRDNRENAEFREAAELDVKKEEDLGRLVQALGGQQWRVKHHNSSI